ncbi:MAG: nicotinate (nicotinamide) nucleotide adenylyltransferase [Bacteroidales bacterium]|nr:nicotinate (nicotinamide) nucleotide adenylyltransferase [Bacteroidales bacterium]
MNVAVYSGSFDPVHIGHQALARYVVSNVAGIDRLLLLVTPHNPLKPLATSAPFADRLAMCQLALSNIPEAEASDFEDKLPAPHFTYHTLCALRRTFPHDRFTLLIGSDNWLIFSKWRDHDKILSEFELLIYPRPGYEIDPATLPPGVRFLADAPTTDLASTALRERLQEGLLVNNLLPEGVDSYISKHNLYGRQQD